MNLTESRLQAALDAGMSQIQTTAAAVADRVCELLSTMAESSTRIIERDLMLSARLDLVRNIASFHGAFRDTLHDRVNDDLGPRGAARRSMAPTDWESLTLVDDHEVEERMAAERIAQQITHECEGELRELNAYMRALLRSAHADDSRNPLRPELVGMALNVAIEAVTEAEDMRKLLARDLGRAMARAMPVCYSEIVRDLKSRGVQPQHLSVRSVEGPGNQLAANSGYSTAGRDWHSTGATANDMHPESGGPHGAGPGPGGLPVGASPSGFSSSGARAHYPAHGAGFPQAGSPAGHGSAGSARLSPSEQADAQLMALLRRLTSLAGHPGGLDPMLQPTGLGGGVDTGLDAAFGVPAAAMPAPGNTAAGVLPSLMAVNLIRAHREELRQASSGRLDHMVIDVVGSLFDQILSDARVPPQMARQIARLQLPVLRVALSDTTFFSSRRHPVRRFVNRMASLACAFEEFEDGPGLEFITRVRELVQEIVDGDFDQIEIYSAKLADLETFIAGQSQTLVQETGVAATFERKESELRLQQRYMLQLQTALAPLALPQYLREFLSQVWSQALVLACTRDGPESDRAVRYRRVGRDLVMSIQPKGSPALRKKFLMQLPPLMKDLHEGMKLLGWSEAAQKEFFGKLLPAHAEALKGQPLSELDHNMMVKQLDTVFAQAVPRSESLSPADAVPQVPEGVMERRFTPDEAKAVGLIEESAVDWSGGIDIDLSQAPGAVAGAAVRPAAVAGQGVGLNGAGARAASAGDASELGTSAGDVGRGTERAEPDSGADSTGDVPVSQLGVDVNLDMAPSDQSEPPSGARLMDHIQLGFAYQMHLKDKWQKVRLTYMSPGRSFFVFSRGRKYQETISMTSRMLSRMCESNRLRAFENAYLMERATQRARKQLAAMKAPFSRH